MVEQADVTARMMSGGRPWAEAQALALLAGLAAVIAFALPTPGWGFAIWAVAAGCGSAALLVAARVSLLHRRLRGHMGAAMALMADDPAPCFCTDATGAVLAGNDAATRRFGDTRGCPVTQALSGLLPNAAAVVYRHEDSLKRQKVTQETVVTPRGAVKLTAYRLGDGIFWRLDEPGPAMPAAGEDIGLPMMIVNEMDHILSVNEAMRDMLGRSVTALDEVFDDRPVVPGRRSRLLAARGPVEVIPVIVPRPNARREVYAVPGLSETPVTTVAARAFEALPVALLHIGPDGWLLASNRHAQGLLGLAPDARCPLSRLFEGLGRPVNDWVMDTLAERIPNRSEVVRARGQDGELFVQITLSRITDKTGPSLLAVLQDATQLKTMEQQFVQSQKMQAVGELAGGVAHDFNNLLTAISGHCDLLMLRHDREDPSYADLQQIHQNANRAAALVGQLLAFSRKQTLEPEIIDLRETMGELVHLLNRLVGEKIELALSHDPDLLPIRADRQKLDQVIMNLVVNARDAMPNGGEIRVETRVVHLPEPLHRDRAEVPAGRYVIIRVLDQGHGIPPDKLARVFEPFWTTKHVGEGTGLGLSMAYGIIKQTGGYIFVDSVVDVGSTFTIYCPVHDRSVTPSLVAGTDMQDAAAQRRDADVQAVILLVEDEAPVRAFAARALRLRGHSVIEAASGEDALEKLQDATLSVDLIVTDVVMPGMDGPSWVRAALEQRPEVKVVFVSGYAEDQIEDGSIGIPNAVFLPKPFSLTDLTDTVQRQLQG